MKNKKYLMILIAVFALIIAGAYFAYNALSDKVNTNRLAVSETFSGDSVAFNNTDSDDRDTENASNDDDGKDVNASDANENTQTGSNDSAVATSEEAGGASGNEESTGASNSKETSGDSSDSEGTLAPDFTVYDGDGNAVNLSDFVGTPVVLNFWASWCPPCKSEMPDFNEKYAELGGDIQFLMVNLTDGTSETVESAKEFIADQGYGFPVYYDTDGDAAKTYGIYSIPTSIFIDAEGYAVAQAIGAIDAEVLQQGIDMIR